MAVLLDIDDFFHLIISMTRMELVPPANLIKL